MTDLDVSMADPDLGKGHPLLQERWPVLEQYLRTEHSMATHVVEVYRPELRQQFLYGAGRSVPQLAEHGISPHFARPAEARVTNAWSARTSAHGYTMGVHPAACAIDVAPLGLDGRPFTHDDPWDEFVRLLALHGPSIGLTHFHSPGKGVWDRPHLQLVEYSDLDHLLHLKGAAA